MTPNTRWYGLGLMTELFWYWKHDATAFYLAVWKIKKGWKEHDADST